MPPPIASPEDEVDARARRTLLSVHEELTGAVGCGDTTFRSWTPVGARKIRKRRFTLLAVDGTPIILSKTALDRDDRKVAGEWRKLGSLALPSTVNYARGLRQADGGFVMTYAPSEDLPDALARADREAFGTLLGRAVDLMAQMHVHDAGGDGSTDPWVAARQYVDEPCVARPELRAALERALVGPTHGDLAPWNVRYDSGSDRMSIIDWEDYRPAGIAAIDVINLLVTLGLVVFPGYRNCGFEWLYDQVLESGTWYAILVRDLIVRYASAVEQPPRFVIDLLPFFCQWLIARISSEGRDTSFLYYGYFLARYVASAPKWVDELPHD